MALKLIDFSPLNGTIFILIVGIAITAVNINQLGKIKEDLLLKEKSEITVNPANQNVDKNRLKVWIKGEKLESGYLDHVSFVFDQFGFEKDNRSWNVLWSHDYPFPDVIKAHNIQTHQKVNHFPGSGFITNKVSLSTSSLVHVPKAFRLPSEKNQLKDYAKLNPKAMWVQKSNSHRGIRVEKMEKMNLESEGTFLQEFIQNPLLIDGRKFDIGIYTTLTSINPLRVYIFAEEVLLRFCVERYYPFNETNIDSYVVGDEYLPIWKVPSLQKHYNGLKLSMKESLNSYLISIGKNPERLWSEISQAISSVYITKEGNLIQAAQRFKSTKHFFEMVRFDFLIDEELNVYLMEANMSPNLSSAHFPENKILYQQVIFSLLSLVGLSLQNICMESKVSDRDISVFSQECLSQECQTSCQNIKCRLCLNCLTKEEISEMKMAYLEHQNKWKFRRILPTSLAFTKEEENISTLLTKNELMSRWFFGKCMKDATWC